MQRRKFADTCQDRGTTSLNVLDIELLYFISILK